MLPSFIQQMPIIFSAAESIKLIIIKLTNFVANLCLFMHYYHQHWLSFHLWVNFYFQKKLLFNLTHLLNVIVMLAINFPASEVVIEYVIFESNKSTAVVIFFKVLLGYLDSFTLCD